MYKKKMDLNNIKSDLKNILKESMDIIEGAIELRKKTVISLEKRLFNYEMDPDTRSEIEDEIKCHGDKIKHYMDTNERYKNILNKL